MAPFLKDGPNKARDLGFRIALSGINTPGGARPAELASEWKKAGIELSAELNPSGDPLELVAQLEARAGSDAEKASLKGLQNLIRENNISLERQKRSTVSNEIRSAVYLVTMLKDCLIKREIIGNLIIVATDRISAFDNILKNRITDKGAILTQMSKFWFDFTKDVVPNHMISVDVKDMPEFFQQERFDGNSMMCKKLEMLPIECIVRGYITGSGWASYKENGTVCGIKLPEGLVESDKLPEPIYTPSTKADLGDHDENISFEQSVEVLEKIYPGKGLDYATQIKDCTIALYKKCAEYALSKGIIIADTKFEFGLDENGKVVLGDEMLTPDSSRFWPLEGYKPGQGQPSFDKQYVRDWLKANPDNDFLLPEEVVTKTVDKYKEAYELLTGKPFTR